MSDLVSILIPAYNAEKWISDTIQSALNQTCPNKEIIVVDDGSRDNTLQFAKAFESATVKIVTQENRGASAARNKALSFAQGDYIQWLDADDLLAPDKISYQLAKRQGTPLTLLSSSFGEFFYRQEKATFAHNALWRDMAPIDFFLNRFTNNLWVQPSVWLVSRNLTEKAGPWNEDLSFDDDGEYFCRVVANSDGIKFVPEAKVYYRKSNIGSLSRSKSHKACESLYRSQRLCIEHLLTLEDSARTRTACIQYLQTWLHYFYPEKEDILKSIYRIAHGLGGSVTAPQLGWKYSLIKDIFGWSAAKSLRDLVRKAKLAFHITIDRMMYTLARR